MKRIPHESGIYVLEWPNGHCYYGQAQNLAHRKVGHFSRMKKGTHHNKRINRLYRKYGLPDFYIMEICNIEFLDEMEQAYLDCYADSRLCCNIEKTAGTARGVKRSAKTKELLRQHRLGKKLPPEQAKKIADAVRKRYAEGWKVIPRYGKDNPYFGKKHSEAIRLKMRKSKNVGENNIRARIVINVESGIFYGCIRDAAKSIPMNPNSLNSMLAGYIHNKTSFRYA